jgi:hypothetical protein
MDEPFIAESRPCSTPRSAPVAWPNHAPPNPDREALIATVVADPELLAEILARAAPDHAPATRHDGWTGERIATFLRILADTGLVTEAARIAGMHRDSAYELRNRDPLVAAAWRAAQARSRPQVADGLLERSITGTVEHYYRDGVLVGERRHYESWLGLAVLKRLDKQAEEDRAEAGLAARIAGDWQAILDALHEGGTEAANALLDPEPDKPDTPPSPPGCDPWDSVWQRDDGAWMTSFVPPPGFDGYESRAWDGFNACERDCTAEEAELLDTHQAAAIAEEQAELAAAAEAERDGFFAMLGGELAPRAMDGGRGEAIAAPFERQAIDIPLRTPI